MILGREMERKLVGESSFNENEKEEVYEIQEEAYGEKSQFFIMLANVGLPFDVVGKNGHQKTEHCRKVADHSPYLWGPLFIATSIGSLNVVLMHSPALSSKPMDSSLAKKSLC